MGTGNRLLGAGEGTAWFFHDDKCRLYSRSPRYLAEKYEKLVNYEDYTLAPNPCARINPKPNHAVCLFVYLLFCFV